MPRVALKLAKPGLFKGVRLRFYPLNSFENPPRSLDGMAPSAEVVAASVDYKWLEKPPVKNSRGFHSRV
ncbi:MAG: hypothetical protein OWQ48_01295 [Desulfurococcus sp.]|nr:hypothetical protein [Desulfurococcus sp.]